MYVDYIMTKAQGPTVKHMHLGFRIIINITSPGFMIHNIQSHKTGACITMLE